VDKASEVKMGEDDDVKIIQFRSNRYFLKKNGVIWNSSHGHRAAEE